MPDNNDWDTALEQMKQVEEKLKADAAKQQKKNQSTRNPMIFVLMGILALLIIGVGAVLFLSSDNSTSPPPTVPKVIEADPAQFDPQISLETVQRFAGDNLRFLSLTMTQVHPDGTVDFSTGNTPTVAYTFVTSDNRELVIVRVADDLTMSRTTRLASPDDTIPDRVEPPSCDIPQLWQLAKTYNAPNDGVANIDYDLDGYHFVIASLAVDLQFNGDCILIRN